MIFTPLPSLFDSPIFCPFCLYNRHKNLNPAELPLLQLLLSFIPGHCKGLLPCIAESIVWINTLGFLRMA